MQADPPLPWSTDVYTDSRTNKSSEVCERKKAKVKHISQRKWQKELQDIIPEPI